MNIPPKKILCPTDFSPLAQRGVRYGLQLAQQMQAQARVVHAYNLSAYFALPEAAVIASHGFATARSVELQQLLDKTLDELKKDAADVDGTLRLGVVHDEIADEAKRWGADLIVLSSHGHTGLAHAIVGSVAERVVRLAPCPVLVVRNES